ncbi:MFS transporter [Streptomyces sodiiphilus]
MVSTGTAPAVEEVRSPLPRAFLVWLAGALVSMLGTGMMYFALGWAASAHGGTVAGLALTAVNLPRAVLLLVGGAVGDRFGARRVMIAGDAAMIAVTMLLAAAVAGLGTPVWLLLSAGLLIGVVDAFYLPASGSMPRRLVGTGQLPRALALRQTGQQLMMFTGGALGGVLVAAAGLGGAALANAVTFAAMLSVLLWLRGRITEPPPRPRDGGPGLLSDIGDGLRIAWGEPVLRAALMLTAAAAGFLLPVVTLLGPLLARAQEWGPQTAGLIVGAQSLGIVAAALTVVRRSGAARPGLAAAAGLLAAGAGTGLLAVSWSPVPAVAGSLLIGAGSGTFGANIAPLVLGTTPDTHLSRVQSLVTVVQSGALLATNAALGLLAERTSPAAVLTLCAAVVTATAVAALLTGTLRGARPVHGRAGPTRPGQ